MPLRLDVVVGKHLVDYLYVFVGGNAANEVDKHSVEHLNERCAFREAAHGRLYRPHLQREQNGSNLGVETAAEYALFLPRFDEAYQLAQEKPLALVALMLYFGIKSLNVFQKHLGDVGDMLA